MIAMGHHRPQWGAQGSRVGRLSGTAAPMYFKNCSCLPSVDGSQWEAAVLCRLRDRQVPEYGLPESLLFQGWPGPLVDKFSRSSSLASDAACLPGVRRSLSLEAKSRPETVVRCPGSSSGDCDTGSVCSEPAAGALITERSPLSDAGVGTVQLPAAPAPASKLGPCKELPGQ